MSTAVFRKAFAVVTVTAFLVTSVTPPSFAQSLLNLPAPGSMVKVTQDFAPAIIKGLTIDTQNPFHFDFIVDTGATGLSGQALKPEAEKLVKYFMAALTVPEDQKWVNLSPYENDRIIPNALGQTEMGRDMLAQDYMLKQLTASLMYPEDETGRKFWERVYEKAQAMYGTTEIPMNTFNKIWITPDKATVYEYESSAFVIERHLKVYLEKDYIALQKNLGTGSYGLDTVSQDQADLSSTITSEVVREVLIPEIEREVNEGETFATLRQIYNAMILATWFRRTLKESLFGQIYANQNKTVGIRHDDPDVKNKIYQQYLEAFQKGAYDILKEDYDAATDQNVIRKYFSGGANYDAAMVAVETVDEAQLVEEVMARQAGAFAVVSVNNVAGDVNRAMLDRDALVQQFEVENLFKAGDFLEALQPVEQGDFTGLVPVSRNDSRSAGVDHETFKSILTALGLTQAKVSSVRQSDTNAPVYYSNFHQAKQNWAQLKAGGLLTKSSSINENSFQKRVTAMQEKTWGVTQAQTSDGPNQGNYIGAYFNPDVGNDGRTVVFLYIRLLSGEVIFLRDADTAFGDQRSEIIGRSYSEAYQYYRSISDPRYQKADAAMLEMQDVALTEDDFQADNHLFFGTNGWRDLLAGRFNIKNVGRMAWAIGQVMSKKFTAGYQPKNGEKIRILVGYDARTGSRDFARRVVEVLSVFTDIEVEFADQVLTTPAIIAMTKGEMLLIWEFTSQPAIIPLNGTA